MRQVQREKQTTISGVIVRSKRNTFVLSKIGIGFISIILLKAQVFKNFKTEKFKLTFKG